VIVGTGLNFTSNAIKTATAKINQSINFIDERVKTTTDIVTKINTNYAKIKQIQQ